MNINFVASAGTGKTTRLIQEIVNKLLNEDCSITDIMVLTFTEKAANELKGRLIEKIYENLNSFDLPKEKKVKLHRQVVYVDSAYIGTFHSVFFRILKLFGLQSGVDSSFDIAGEQDLNQYLDLFFEKWILEDFQNDKDSWDNIIKIFDNKHHKIRDIFKSLYMNRLKIKNINYDDKDKTADEIESLYIELEKLLQIIKDKIDPDEYSLLKKIVEKKNIFLKYTTGDERLKSIQQSIQEKLHKIKDLTQHYNSLIFLEKFEYFRSFVDVQKQQNKILDFDDILEKTIKLLDDKQIREVLREKFRYIFIDEFQDTDSIQIEILRKISNSNIFTFGDPKQCIYTWRQADLNAYFSFIKDFEHNVLDKNYRSTPNLVKFFNAMFSNSTYFSDEHIGEIFKKPLHYNKDDSDGSYVKLVEVGVKDRTGRYERKSLQALATAKIIHKLVSEENLKYKDIMVLFKENSDIQFFAEILAKQGIPVSAFSNANLFDKPEIKLILNILRVIENRQDVISLLNILKSKFLKVSDMDIYNSRDNLLNINHPVVDFIKKISNDVYTLTLEEIVEVVVDEIPSYLKLDSLEELSVIGGSLNRLKQIAREKTREGFYLRDFIFYLETSREPVNFKTDENSVVLLTMHKSKGLQSRAVIIPMIDLFPYSINLNNVHVFNGKPILNMPRIKSIGLNDSTVENMLKREIEWELRRLFYVATTRAEEKLIMVSSGLRVNKNSNIKSYHQILNETLIESFDDLISVNRLKVDELLGADAHFQNNVDNLLSQNLMQPENLETIKKLYEMALKNIRFTSVSEIMHSQNLEEGVDIITHKNQENIGVYAGTIIHNILELIDFKDYLPEKAQAIATEMELMIPEPIREETSKRVFELLNRFERSEILKLLQKVNILHRELPFVMEENGRFIEGRIDMIFEKEGVVYVMDYKTNVFSTDEEKEKIIKEYEVQKNYYLKAVKKIYPDKDVKFMLGLIWSGEAVIVD